MTHTTILIRDVKPQPKGRPRFANGKAYTPRATRSYEKLLAWHYRHAVKEPLEGDLGVLLIFITKSRADLDNLAKAALDAGNKILFKDDSQIKMLETHRLRGDVEEIQLRIYKMEGK